ncbi:hypothetical protein [Streptomyces sp. NPDC021356]|uniref:hypothetical protein n=1 Tax=Streptomyces sp. NPDC021356 TaxID=3154900 RepID=UPI0033E9E8DD
MSVSTDAFGISQEERLGRLRAQLQGRQVGLRPSARKAPARGAGLLYGVMLRGAARVEAGLELTDLEEQMVSLLRVVASEEEVREFGRVFREEQALGASSLFPAALSERALEEGYTLADLAGDLPGVREEVMAQPNLSLVDLDRVPEGAGLDSAEFTEGVGAYGHGVTVVTASDHRAEAQSHSPLTNVTIELDRFKCYEASGEIGHDELYWALAATSDTDVKQHSITRTYGGVTDDDLVYFDDGTMLFHNGTVQDYLNAHVILWEEDGSPDSWREEMKEVLGKIVDFLKRLADALKLYGGHFPVPEYHDLIDFVEVAGMIGMAIMGLIELFTNHDDKILERTFVFDRAALTAWFHPTRDPACSKSWEFDGGDSGRYLLVATASGTVPPPPPIPTRLCVISAPSAPETVWGPVSELPPLAMRGAPALAAVRDKLVCVARDENDALLWSVFNGTAWSAFAPVPGVTGVRDIAMAEMGSVGKAYCVFRAAGKLHLIAFDGTSWTTPVTHPDAANWMTALGTYGSELACVARGGPGRGDAVRWALGDPADFASWKFNPVRHPEISPASALVGAGTALHLVSRSGRTGHELIWSAFNGVSWSEPAPLPLGNNSAVPGLGYSYGKVHCMIRKATGELAWSRLTGSTWEPGWHNNLYVDTTAHAPALAYVRPGPLAGPDAPYGRLYCVYRA